MDGITLHQSLTAPARRRSVVLLVGLAGAACGGSDPAGPAGGCEPHPYAGEPPAPAAAPFAVRLAAPPAQVAAGRAVTLQVTVRHTGGPAADFSMIQDPRVRDPYAAGVNVVVTTASGCLVWARVRGERPDVALVRPMAAGDSFTVAATWGQEDNDGGRVRPGAYRVHAVIDGGGPNDRGRFIGTDTLAFTIR